MTNYGTTKESIDYKTFLLYIESLKKTNMKTSSLQVTIRKLKTYFSYLQEENYRADNPVEKMIVNGAVKTVLNNRLTSDELEDLYYS